MENIPAVQNTNLVRTAEFLSITFKESDGSIETIGMSSAYEDEVINGQLFEAIGPFLALESTQRDLRATSFNVSFSLSGIDPQSIYVSLSNDLRGAEVKIYRGFYNEDGTLNRNTSPPSLRFTGIVTSYNIEEVREDKDDTFTIAFNCSSIKETLENQVVGRRTNDTSWRNVNPLDSSMRNVSALESTNFDFGKGYQS